MTDVEKALEDWDVEHSEDSKKEFESLVGESLSGEMTLINGRLLTKVLLPKTERIGYTILLAIVESISKASSSKFEEVLLKLIKLKSSGLVEEIDEDKI